MRVHPVAPSGPLDDDTVVVGSFYGVWLAAPLGIPELQVVPPGAFAAWSDGAPFEVQPDINTVAVVLTDGLGARAGQGAHYSLLVHRRTAGGFEALHYDSLPGTHAAIASSAHSRLADFTQWGGAIIELSCRSLLVRVLVVSAVST